MGIREGKFFATGEGNNILVVTDTFDEAARAVEELNEKSPNRYYWIVAIEDGKRFAFQYEEIEDCPECEGPCQGHENPNVKNHDDYVDSLTK